MEQPIIIDDNEMAEFILREIKTRYHKRLDISDVFAVLDLEIEFLRLKGVIEE